MIKLNLKLPGGGYPITIGKGVINELPSFVNQRSYSSVIVLTDDNVGPLWSSKVKAVSKARTETIVILPGEKEKTLTTLGEVWSQLQTFGADRKSLLLNLGGGVVGDIGGFAASTFMRGIDFVQLPTTLLAQVDASVGGKTGIDHVGVKNLVGTFAQPQAVFIDVDFLSTLPPREFASGFAEIIKHGVIADPPSFELASSKAPHELTPDELIQLIHWSCLVKSKIVEADERETSVRKLLNFGHTAGHAVESASLLTSKPLLHGEAVSIGMMVEAKLSELLGYFPSADYERLEQSLQKAALPTQYVERIHLSELWRLMRGDKKSKRGIINWSLPSSIGAALRDIVAPDHFVNDALRSALPNVILDQN